MLTGPAPVPQVTGDESHAGRPLA